jgi:hypothetical protein
MHWWTLGALVTAVCLLVSMITLQRSKRLVVDGPSKPLERKTPARRSSLSKFMDLDHSEDNSNNNNNAVKPKNDNGNDSGGREGENHRRPTSRGEGLGGPSSLKLFSTVKTPFVSKTSFLHLQRALQSIIPNGPTDVDTGTPTITTTSPLAYMYTEIPIPTPEEETTFYDVDQPQSATSAAVKYGPRLRFAGNSKQMAYLSTALFVVDPTLPEVGDHLHFIGQASFSEDLTVVLHVSTPPGDNFWYVTLKDVIKKNDKGENQTPVIAYTECKVNPWQENHGCLWMVHEGPQVGWKKSSSLQLHLVL